MSFWYLATEYSKFPGGHDAAHDWAVKNMFELVDKGIDVYCPIAHNHTMAKLMDPKDYTHDRFMELDMPFMATSQGLIVVKSPGWETSRGVNFEIGYFSGQGKTIIYYDPNVDEPEDVLKLIESEVEDEA